MSMYAIMLLNKDCRILNQFWDFDRILNQYYSTSKPRNIIKNQYNTAHLLHCT